MKKVIFALIIMVAMISVIKAQERISLVYNGGTTVYDQKVLTSGDTIVKVGTHSNNEFFGELFFDRTNYIGIYGSYGFQSGLIDQYKASDFKSWSVGLISTIDIEPVWWKISVGYFSKTSTLEGYTSENSYFKDSAYTRGLELRTSILFAQDDSRIIPRLEIWGRTGFSCYQNKMFLEGYEFGADVQIYRFDIMPDYFLAPMLGVEKKEVLPLSLLTYKVGLALGSNFSPTPIAKLYGFISYNNTYYTYGNVCVKTPVFGIGCTISPASLFWRRANF